MKLLKPPKSLSLQTNHPLSALCTLGIGGPARYFIEVTTIEAMQEALGWVQENALRYLVIGKGSNCLFDDRGFDGVVILNKIASFEDEGNGCFHVGAGYSFSLLGAQTARKGWSGLEFASGIPGSVGGAVFMNAGANGHETCETIQSVDFVESDASLRRYFRDELSFAYRTSPFQTLPGAIVGATFQLMPSDEARQTQIEIITYRKKTQPYGEKSAGCIFRNPECGHAGALIEQSGLKGTECGGAKVSELHANFIVNNAGASSADILGLITQVKKQVMQKTGQELESEVRYIPYDGGQLLV